MTFTLNTAVIYSDSSAQRKFDRCKITIIVYCENIDDVVLIESCLTKSFPIRDIFGSSSKVFVNLRLSIEIFENLRSLKITCEAYRVTFGLLLENLRKSLESGRNLWTNVKKSYLVRS